MRARRRVAKEAINGECRLALDERAFGRLPNNVALSGTLSWQAKLVYAFRSTFAGTFRLHERARRYGVTDICSRGLGKNAARSAIAEFLTAQSVARLKK